MLPESYNVNVIQADLRVPGKLGPGQVEPRTVGYGTVGPRTIAQEQL